MTTKYNLHSLSDMVSLAQYVQSRVYWGGYFIRKEDETSHRWQYFWDILEGAIEDGCKYVSINDTEHTVEFNY